MKTVPYLIVRATVSEDLPHLAQLYQAIYTEMGEPWTLQAADELLSFYFSVPSALAFTAVYEETIVGAFLSYVKPWFDGAHLAEGEFFVAQDYQKRGIGACLYYEMMREAHKQGCEHHELLTYPGKPAEGWYRKIGFTDSGQTHLTGNIAEVLAKMGEL